MTKMGIICFHDGSYPTDFVAPMSDYPTKESFIEACQGEFDYYEEHQDKVTIENVKEGHCRFYPVAPEGLEFDNGCYSFCGPGKGAFEVWYIELSG